MRISTTIKKARELWDKIGWTSNKNWIERDAEGKPTAACGDAALTLVKRGNRFAREFMKQTSLMGFWPGEYNDVPGRTKEDMEFVFDSAYIAALDAEGRDVEKALVG